MTKTAKRAAMALLWAACGAASSALAAEEPNPPQANRTCAETFATDRLTPNERIELIVDLAYHGIQSRQPGMRLLGAQAAVLGLVIEEACRRSPAATLGEAVDLAVQIALDARPSAKAALAAR